eukprot:358290-Chlamydomonas_euryale.AAC.1
MKAGLRRRPELEQALSLPPPPCPRPAARGARGLCAPCWLWPRRRRLGLFLVFKLAFEATDCSERAAAAVLRPSGGSRGKKNWFGSVRSACCAFRTRRVGAGRRAESACARGRHLRRWVRTAALSVRERASERFCWQVRTVALGPCAVSARTCGPSRGSSSADVACGCDCMRRRDRAA